MTDSQRVGKRAFAILAMFSISLILCPQVHVLNLPIGYKTPSVGRDAAHLENCKWKVEEKMGENGNIW